MIASGTLQEKKMTTTATGKKKKLTTTNKEPVYTFEAKIKEGKVAKTYKIELKRPTRSVYSEADMFYSIQINKYIKMGLLTAEQLAKKQIDAGGTFSEEQQKEYAKVQSLISEKDEMLIRLMKIRTSLWV